MGYGYTYPDLYAIIILILIVLQWMGTPTTDPNNLVNNGGLFIITLFSIVACICTRYQIPYRYMPYRYMPYRRMYYLYY
ncbi:hypothetical protein [Fonticella tunisiensis]|uniref:Uncharacterized protein n=1 Tax=Fonticella tunisiensis TaxID=1096341 RepID=A0A4R7KQL0_9CLOT|nr:hypothetical protein [Fonticella tunisiensis]TDT58444.1 hypothetical protein EDD71_11192 [Fonticella tunisiensis]